jgi:uncharacterized protein YukE
MNNGIDSRHLAVPLDLEHAGPYINSVAQQASDELTQLRNRLQPVLEIWCGDAMDYYSGLQDEWNIAAEGLLGPEGVLGTIAHAMNITWKNYTECEWANVQTWKHT